MSKNINTLIPDIYNLFGSGVSIEPAALAAFSDAVAGHVARALAAPDREGSPGLRGSNLGEICDRRSWYLENKKEEGDKIPPHTLLKFLYGPIIEELILLLAEEAGHSVKLRQAEVSVGSVSGHIDAVIDGCLIDVKSANSRGMDKFRKHELLHDDPFSYLTQLKFYLTGLLDNPTVEDKSNVHFIAVDKELGHIVLDTYRYTDKDRVFIEAETKRKLALVQNVDVVPERGVSPVADGQSGNMVLPTKCAYCSHKGLCHKSSNNGRGLRQFIFSRGPKWFTKVVREPDVFEVKKEVM